MLEMKATLEQRRDIPDSSWNLPRDEYYVKLGCISCPNQICFTAKGVTSEVPSYSRTPRDTADLKDIIQTVEKKSDVLQGGSSVYDVACDDVCEEAEAIEVTVELLNERFDASLKIGEMGQ